MKTTKRGHRCSRSAFGKVRFLGHILQFGDVKLWPLGLLTLIAKIFQNFLLCSEVSGSTAYYAAPPLFFNFHRKKDNKIWAVWAE